MTKVKISKPAKARIAKARKKAKAREDHVAKERAETGNNAAKASK